MSLIPVSFTPAEFLAQREEIGAVYGAAFAGPPYCKGGGAIRAFLSVLEGHVARPGFQARVVVGEEGQLVGFCYGYTGSPGHWWRESIVRALDAATAARWLTDYFELVELAVAPPFQGRGVGGRLHDALLVRLPHRTAALSTSQVETAATHLYRRRGWRPILEDFTFPGNPLPYTIMGLDLAHARFPARDD